MQPVGFEKVVVSRRQEGELVIAYFDGVGKTGEAHELVAMLCCSDRVALALENALRSARKARPRT